MKKGLELGARHVEGAVNSSSEEAVVSLRICTVNSRSRGGSFNKLAGEGEYKPEHARLDVQEKLLGVVMRLGCAGGRGREVWR